MVQITKQNFIGPLRGNQSFSQVTPGIAKVQNAQDVSDAIGKASGLLQQIKNTSDEMEYQRALTDAQLQFGTAHEERSSIEFLEDGSPAHKTLDSDTVTLASTVKNNIRDRISSRTGREKFDLQFDNYVAKKRIQGLGTARNQAISIAQGEFSTALDNISTAASNPENRDNLASFITQGNTLIDNAAKGGLINKSKVAGLKRSLSEGVHESVIRQQINENPLLAQQALLQNSAKDLGVPEVKRIDLQNLATKTLATQRSAANTLETQRVNASNAQIDVFMNKATLAIKSGGIEGSANGVGVSDIEAMEATIDELRYEESFEGVADPVQRAAIISRNVSSAKYADDQKTKLRNAFNARNKEARTRADKIATNNKDLARGITLTPENATFMYRENLDPNATPAERMEQAITYNQPQKDLQNNIVQAVTAGNAAALDNWVDENGQTQLGFLGVYDKLRQENPRVLKGMGKNDVNKLAYLNVQVGSGVPMQDALDVLTNKFDTVSDSLREGRLKEYNKGEGSQELREYIEDRVINQIAGVTSGRGDATPQLRSTIALLGEEMYQIHGDRDAAADAVALLLQDAGETSFPVRSQGFFGNNKEVMAVTPEKFMGWNKKESQLAISKMKKDLTTWAKINDIDPETIFIESDERTTSPFQQKTWAVFGVTENGQTVRSDQRYSPDDRKALMEESRDQTYKENRENDDQLTDWRNRWGIEGDGFTAPTHDSTGAVIPKQVRDDAKANIRHLKAVSKSGVIKSRVDAVAGGNRQAAFNPATATLPDIASVFVRDIQDAGNEIAAVHAEAVEFVDRWNAKLWQTVTPKIAQFFNEYFFRALAGDAEAGPAEAMNMSQVMQSYGQIAANEPQLAAQLFDDSQENRNDETEMEPDDVDGSVNVTGKTPEQVESERMDSMMQDTRHLTASTNPIFSDKLEEDEFNAALRIMRDNVAAPEQVFPHASAMKYLKSKPKSERTGTEHNYYKTAKLREEKHGGETPRDDLWKTPEAHDIVTADPLLNRVYQSETYRASVYDDGLGNKTIGIGWNLDDESASTTTNWLNRINGQSGGTIYNLERLRAGHQKLSPQDAVKVLQQQVRQAGFAAGKHLGKGMFNMTVAQQRVATDMSFQLGITSFRKFSNFRKALVGNKMMEAPIEILRSTVAKNQTPLRFAEHYKAFVSGGKYTAEEKETLKQQALKFYKNNKVKNISGNDFTQDAINIIKEIR